MRSFSEGNIICREGDVCEHAFTILSGEVDVITQGNTTIAGKDAIFGVLNFVKSEPYSNTVIARIPVTVKLLSLADIEELVSKNTPSAKPETPPADGMVKIVEGIERIINTLNNNHSSSAEHAPARESYASNSSCEISSAGQSSMGPITPLIEDDRINDILINGHDNIFVERAGIMEKTDITFENEAQLFELAKNILKDLGRKIDLGRPLVDARLLDGSRVNIIAPPLAVDGTSISIRKFSKKIITLDSMAENNTLNKEIADFLKVVGKCRLNVVISGGTGSGKTTLLNAISQHISKDERIVTIEDAAELRLQQPHVVRLETRPHHIGMKADEDVSMRDLVKNALRMRPDRIIVGEVRGPEAFDMLQAMNSGHEGSLTTVHANHPRDALSRLENMISMADLQIPIKSLRYQIASALHLIVQISRMRDGQRRITYISEVVGMEGDMITMHDLFNYKQDGEDAHGKLIGKFKWSGIMPRFVRRIEYYGELARLESALGVKFPKGLVGK